MERDIKFRVWNVKESQMSEPFTFADVVSNESFGMATTAFVDVLFGIPVDELHNESKYILMQFTGLKDKNGRDIYEGDIILHNKKVNTNERYKRVIIFKDGCYGYNRLTNGCEMEKFQPLSHYHFSGGSIKSRNPFYEIIGNIHENPELIK